MTRPMVHLDIRKVDGGLDYMIGSLVIARGRWYKTPKSKTGWHMILYLAGDAERNFGIAAMNKTIRGLTATDALNELKFLMTHSPEELETLLTESTSL